MKTGKKVWWISGECGAANLGVYEGSREFWIRRKND